MNFDKPVATDKPVASKGGIRAGAGRPRNKIPRHTISLYVTEEEENILNLLYHFVRFDYQDKEQLKTIRRYLENNKRRWQV